MRAGSVFKTTTLFLLGRLVIALWVLPIVPVQAMDDPTRPPTAEAKTSDVLAKKTQRPRWTLHSTLVSSGRRTAVINDRVVSQGDRINGAAVISIQPSAVRLREKGREVTLMMLKKNIKSLSDASSSGQGK